MLQHENTTEVKQGYVDLQHLDGDAVKLVVDYMYSGRIEFAFYMAEEVIKVIDHFQIIDKIQILQEKISEYIIPHLCPDNCLGWFKFGELMDLNQITTKAHSIMIQRLREVSKSPELVSLSFEDITYYMRKATQSFYNHDHCLNALIIWAMHDAKNRTEMFGEILPIIDLHKCSVRCIKVIYDTYGEVPQNNLNLVHQFTIAAFNVIVTRGYLDRSCNVFNRKTWLLNLVTGSCVERPSQTNTSRANAMCASPDGMICAGDRPTSLIENSTTDCVLYHKDMDIWVALPPLPVHTVGAGATCVQNAKVMVVGGFAARVNKAVCLDLTTRRWSDCDDML
jgi:hypothetical protein